MLEQSSFTQGQATRGIAPSGREVVLLPTFATSITSHLRQDWWNKGEWTDTLIYGTLTSDFPAVHSR